MADLVRIGAAVLPASFTIVALANASLAADSPFGVNWTPVTGKLVVAYKGAVVFSGTATASNPAEHATAAWQEADKPAEPVFLGYPHGPRDAGGVPEGLESKSLIVTLSGETAVRLSGSVRASRDAVACIPDGGPEMVRGYVALARLPAGAGPECVGASRSALNTGVYDRTGDWAIYVAPARPRAGASAAYAAEPASCRIQPARAGFTLEATGPTVKLIFKPDFYRVHRGYFYWSPTTALWTKPVSGWCSWAAHAGSVREQDVLAAADLIARELRDYGYDIIQIDDGYQTFAQADPSPLAPGETVADYWTTSNKRFPHGMAWMAGQISSRGLTPGIWVSTSLPLGMPEEWYVTDPDGKPHRGPWVNYAINGNIPQAVEDGFRKTFRGLKQQGWRYFKVDTVRHIIYDSYRQVPGYWRARGENMEAAFRNIFQGISDEIGPSIYMLSCWGTIPELAGIADGCRIGEDVSGGWGSTTKAGKYTCQFNYLNNIVWRNDPDYMCLRLPVEQGRSWASFVALTGMQLMISDPASSYDEPRLDILRKVGPPLLVRPTTLHSLQPNAELWLLEIDSPEAPYLVFERVAWPKEGLAERRLQFSEIGLAPDRPYHVWDFWNEKYLGEQTGGFNACSLAEGECRVYAVRPALDRPQVLSTNRHIGQGAYELEHVGWSQGKLSGTMKLPPGREFKLYIHVPQEWRLTGCSPTGQLGGHVLTIPLSSPHGGAVPWSARFTRASH